MKHLEKILSDNNTHEKQWQDICAYAKELSNQCIRLSPFAPPDDELRTAVKELLKYADKLETGRKLELYQHMIACAEYFDKKDIYFWLKNIKTIDSFDYEILISGLNHIILEERNQEEQRIANITYTKQEIMEMVCHLSGIDYPVSSGWHDYGWKLLCTFIHDAFDMEMSVYRTGKGYAVPAYDAAILISYGVIIEKHKSDDFLDKIRNRNYNSVTVTQWNIFWNLEFQAIRELLAEYIKTDKTEYGVCPHSSLLCKECSEFFHCNHMSSITRTIQSTELTVQQLLKIRDGAIKTNTNIQEKVKSYFDFLCKQAQSVSADKREAIIQAYLYTLLKYLISTKLTLSQTERLNEYYRFLFNSDFEIDEQNEKVIVPFPAPPLLTDWNETTLNSTVLLEYILSALTDYFDKIKMECYHCMMICPSKSPLAKPIEQSNILRQKSILLKKSICGAIDNLERWFKKEIKNYP